MKGISKRLKGANVTLSGKQKLMPGAKPGKTYKPIPLIGPDRKFIKGRNKIAAKKSSRA